MQPPGFSRIFKIQLGTAKILGAVALLLPFVPKGFKQFAYAGFVINMMSATIAHAATALLQVLCRSFF
ncbi:MAG: DoxX family protein [Taibaiella sp.]|nr:DoxX family protein [Taibaiella sp.]